MTEAEWLRCGDPAPMMTVVEQGAKRKRRLFALSCCQRVEYLLNSDDFKLCRRAIALLECQIEQTVDERELRAAISRATGESIDAAASVANPGETDLYAIAAAATTVECIKDDKWTNLVERAADAVAYDSLSRSANYEVERLVALWQRGWRRFNELDWRKDHDAVRLLPEFLEAREIEQRRHVHLLRCVFGNPFRAVAFADSWRSETAHALATGIYAERAFDRLPILADALEETGCDHPDILAHCRGPGPHVRGCWVVDLVLGKV